MSVVTVSATLGLIFAALSVFSRFVKALQGLGFTFAGQALVSGAAHSRGFPLNSDISSASKNGKLHFNLGDIF